MTIITFPQPTFNNIEISFSNQKVRINLDNAARKFYKNIPSDSSISFEKFEISPIIRSMSTLNNLDLKWNTDYKNHKLTYGLDIKGYLSKKGSFKLKLSTLLALSYSITKKVKYKNVNDVISNLFGNGYPFKKEINGLMLWKGADILRNFFDLETEILNYNYIPTIYYDFKYINNILDLEILLFYIKK